MYSDQVSGYFPGDVVFFRDSLQKNNPFIFQKPRNHESIFIVTNGTFLYERADICQTLETGQVGYIARGSVDISSAFACDEVSYISMNFCFDRVSASPRPTLSFPVCCVTDREKQYEKLFRDALYAFLSKNAGSTMICNGIALQIIGMLSAELSEDHREVRSKQQIKQAVELFHARCEDPNLTIREIASASDMSERSLRRHFDEVYHQTPYSFLQEIRIDRAKILLMSTTKSIAEIALQCGFSDVYSFSHCFKNHVGIAPSIYRDQKPPLIYEERK